MRAFTFSFAPFLVIVMSQVEHTKDLLRMKLTPGSKWRANPANLPGPLVLLAVDAGAGFVPVGPTEAKKGRTVRRKRRGSALKETVT